MSNVKPIPEGFNTLSPYLCVEDAQAAIELYQKALGAEVMSVHNMGGKVINAQLKIGNSMLMLNDEFPDFGALGPNKVGGSSVTTHIYTEDAQALYDRAVAAGFEPTMPFGKQPWGDMYGGLKDAFGHHWSIATHVEDVSEDEMARRMSEMGM